MCVPQLCVIASCLGTALLACTFLCLLSTYVTINACWMPMLKWTFNEIEVWKISNLHTLTVESMMCSYNLTAGRERAWLLFMYIHDILEQVYKQLQTIT